MTDVANQPHYTDCGIQPIEYMRANMTHEAFKGYLVGNIIKYVSRFDRKNGVEDLKKAQVYLGWLIDEEVRFEKEAAEGLSALFR